MIPHSLVSVIIPCFNAAGCLPRAVQSVLAQDQPGTEILIVDDCSTDDSRTVATALAEQHPGVRLWQQPVNAGAAAARNAGWRQARGRYVCFLDADDEYAPGFLSRVIPLLEVDSGLAAVTTGIELVHCTRPVHPVQLAAIIGSSSSNLLLRRGVVELLGGYAQDPALHGEVGGEDILFRLALKRWFRTRHCPEPFLRYWVSPGGHLNYFLERSQVVQGQLLFTDQTREERSGALALAQERYLTPIRQKLAALSTLRTFAEGLSPLAQEVLGGAALYEDLRERFDSVAGFLHPQECFTLYQAAREGLGRGAIVEVGSLLGRGTCWLAAGTRAAGREKVVAIDHFRGSPEHQADGSQPVPEIVLSGTTLPTFLLNLQRCGLRDWVEVLVSDSAAAGMKWTGPIRLLVLDGDATLAGVQQNLEIWTPQVVPGGLLALPGVAVSPDSTQAYQAFLEANHSWKTIHGVRSLRLIQRLE